MRESRKTHLGKPCDICGHVGYEESLVACFQCKIAREHIYCMRTNLWDVPKSWFCEECRSNNRTMERKLPGEAGLWDSYRRGLTVQTSKVKFLPAEEAKMLSSGAKTKISLIQGGLGSRNATSDSIRSISERTPRTPPRCFHQKGNGSSIFTTLGNSSPLKVCSPISRKKPQAAQHSKLLHGEKTVRPGIQSVPALKSEQSSCKKCGIDDKYNKTRELELDISAGRVTPAPKRDQISMEEPIDDVMPICMEEPIEATMPIKEVEISHAKTGCKLYEEISASSSSMVPQYISNLGGKLSFDPKPKNYDVHARDLGGVLQTDEDLPNRPSIDATWKYTLGVPANLVVSPLLIKNRSIFESSTSDRGKLFEDILVSTSSWVCLHKEFRSVTVLIRDRSTIDLRNTWIRGSFEILDKVSSAGLYDGFLAYPSCRVARKAYEFSKHLPGVLKLMLHPLCDVWRDIFGTDENCPDWNDIALYFMPSDPRSKQKYCSLLELIETHDFMLKSCFDGVELLVFSSKRLHVNCQRLNEETYLWGVFHCIKGNKDGKKTFNKAHGVLSSRASPMGQPHEDRAAVLEGNVGVIDMEIDMIGGKDVGRIDISVPRSPLQRNKIQFRLQPKTGKVPSKSQEIIVSSSDLAAIKDMNESCNRADRSKLGETASSKHALGSLPDDMNPNIPLGPKEVTAIKNSFPEIINECLGDLDVPPGFSKQDATENACGGSLEKSPARIPPVLEPLVGSKNERQNVCSGFSRQLTSDAALKGSLLNSLIKPEVQDILDISTVFYKAHMLKERNDPFDATEEYVEPLRVEGSIFMPQVRENRSLESASRGVSQDLFFPPHEPLEKSKSPVNLTCYQVSVGDLAMSSVAPEHTTLSRKNGSDQPRMLIHADQKDYHQSHIKMGELCNASEKLPIMDDRKTRSKYSKDGKFTEKEQEKTRPSDTMTGEIFEDGKLQNVCNPYQQGIPSRNDSGLQPFLMKIKIEAGEHKIYNLSSNPKLDAGNTGGRNLPRTDADSLSRP